MFTPSYKGGKTTRLLTGKWVGVVNRVKADYGEEWMFLVRRRRQSKIAYQGYASSQEAAMRRVAELMPA
jgi:hypothetical protein